MARSTARKRALNTLYEADEKGQDILSLLAERIAVPGAQTPLPDYAIEIVRGVADHRRQIDRALNEHSTRWKVRRMGVVDRNILRIATWEILFNDEVPDKVAIDEALGLAKTLCDDDAPPFIHGLLSAVCAAKSAYVADDDADAADADAPADDSIDVVESSSNGASGSDENADTHVDAGSDADADVAADISVVDENDMTGESSAGDDGQLVASDASTANESDMADESDEPVEVEPSTESEPSAGPEQSETEPAESEPSGESVDNA